MRLPARLFPVTLALSALVAATPSYSAVSIQELFDNASLDVPLAGQGNFNGQSVGFTPGSVWTANPAYAASANIIYSANNFNLGPVPGPSPDAGALGGLYRAGNTDFSTAIWESRSLTAAAAVNMGVNGVRYFSFRLNNTGDVAVGFGLSSGTAANSEFIGWGGHWDNQADLNGVEARNSLYQTGGTLGQDLAGNNDGVYAMINHTPTTTLNGRAFVVGKITTSATGADVVNVKMYFDGNTISTNPDALAWDLTTNFNSSANLNQALVWINGAGQAELDAIRVGDTWTDVTGVVPEPASATLLLLGATFAATRRRRTSVFAA